MRNESAPSEFDPAEFLAAYERSIVADGASDMNHPIIADFRANGGPSGMLAGSPLLLTTTGVRSGKPRTAPVVYTRDGDRYVVMASRAGAPVNPAWYHNVVAHPRATVELGEESFEVVCSVAGGEERDRLFAGHLAQMPEQIRAMTREYRRKTTRRFPMVILAPVC
jgi:deazaflavin-dependent oxidoreductase (nitroreductase family)